MAVAKPWRERRLPRAPDLKERQKEPIYPNFTNLIPNLCNDRKDEMPCY